MRLEHIHVRRIGNSLGILLPRRTVRSMGVKPGDELALEILKAHRIDGFGIWSAEPSARKEVDELRHQRDR